MLKSYEFTGPRQFEKKNVCFEILMGEGVKGV